MTTRASHSSLCFLRVAEASAASSASKITSLSTPFSLETASTTIRISLFTAVLPLNAFSLANTAARFLGRKPRLADLLEAHRDLLAIDLERDPAIIDREQRAGVAAPSGARLLQLDEHPRAEEAAEMGPGAQHPVETRRGHFQRVRGCDRVRAVEQWRALAAHAAAILEGDPGGSVDEQPQHGVGSAGPVLELDQLESEPSEHRFDEGDQPLPQESHVTIASAPPQTKMGPKAPQKKSPAGGFPVSIFRGCRRRKPPDAFSDTSHPSPRASSAGPRGRAFYRNAPGRGIARHAQASPLAL